MRTPRPLKGTGALFLMMSTYQLFCEEDLAQLKRLPSDSIDCVITDPPYAQTGASSSAVPMAVPHGIIVETQFYEAWIREHLREWVRILHLSGAIWMTCDWRGALCVEAATYQLGLRKPKIGVWHRRGLGMGHVLRNVFECFLVLLLEQWKRKKTNEPDVWEHAWYPSHRTSGHAAEKPVELMRRACDLICPEGRTILDPFMGTGTTGVAAIQGGYSFSGIEREEAYIDIAKKRMGEAAALGRPE